MRCVFLVLLLTACGGHDWGDNPRGIPIQLVMDTDDERAVGEPWVQRLNQLAGCKWVYTGDERCPVDNSIGYIQNSALVEGTLIDGKEVVGYWDGRSIIMLDRVTTGGWPEGEQSLIFLHELGHAVGFRHRKVVGDWMHPEVQVGLLPELAAQQFIDALGGPRGLCARVRDRIAGETQ